MNLIDVLRNSKTTLYVEPKNQFSDFSGAINSVDLLFRNRSINLALACRRCNERRYNFVAGIDPDTQEIVPIFNPRKQKWEEHFVWLNQGVVIEGTTPIGRATCLRLDLNDTRYPENDSIRETRRFWIKTGLHPQADDPCQA